MRIPLVPYPCQHLVLSVLDFSHFNRCVAASCYFNLHISDDIWWGAYFHLLACHLYLHLCWAVCSDLLPIFNRVAFFILLSFKRFFYLVHFWYQSCIKYMFSKVFFSFFMSVACLFILLPVSFAEMFLILMKSNFFFFCFMGPAFGIMSKRLLPTPRSPRCVWLSKYLSPFCLIGEGKRRLSLCRLCSLSPPHSLKPATVLFLDYALGLILAINPLLCMDGEICVSFLYCRPRQELSSFAVATCFKVWILRNACM